MFSSAANQAKINALSPGEQNLFAGLADLSGVRFGGPSPLAVAGGVQLGNFVGSLAAFGGQSGGAPSLNEARGALLYPSNQSFSQMPSVYSK